MLVAVGRRRGGRSTDFIRGRRLAQGIGPLHLEIVGCGRCQPGGRRRPACPRDERRSGGGDAWGGRTVEGRGVGWGTPRDGCEDRRPGLSRDAADRDGRGNERWRASTDGDEGIGEDARNAVLRPSRRGQNVVVDCESVDQSINGEFRPAVNRPAQRGNGRSLETRCVLCGPRVVERPVDVHLRNISDRIEGPDDVMPNARRQRGRGEKIGNPQSRPSEQADLSRSRRRLH